MKNHTRRLGLAMLSFTLLASCTGNKGIKQKDVTYGGKSYKAYEKLVVGMECNYAPFNWTETGKSDSNLKISNTAGYAEGYDVKVSKALGKELGLEVEIVSTKWESLIPDLNAGTINMICAGMTDTEEREESINFSNEYYRSEVVLLARKDVSDQYTGKTLVSAEMTDLLSGKNVVSQKGTVEDDIAGNFSDSENGFGASHAAPAETYGLAATDVSNGIADFLVVELPVAESYVNALGNVGIIHMDQAILGVDQSQLGVSIGIKKGDDEFRDLINLALETISADDRLSMMSEAVKESQHI